MNKIIKSSIIVMIVLSFIMSITSCTKSQEAAYIPPYPHPELPSKAVQEEIISAYNQDPERYIKAFEHFQYYGEFNGCYVLTVLGMIEWSEEIVVADYTFYRDSSLAINAYKDGEIKTINEAYDSGWLTKDDIAYLSNYHKYAGLPVSERTIPVNTQPNLKPGKLDKETREQFDYLFRDGLFNPTLPFPDKILHYGNYDGAIVFYIEWGEKNYTEYTTHTGEVISSDRKFSFVIHKNERIYQAVASDLHRRLTDEVISEIVKYHNSRNK